jgi:ATP-binding cassette subfamily F protein uup
MEAAILAAESAIAELEAPFMDPEFFTKNGAKLKELTADLDRRRAEVERLYARWQELQDKAS